MLGKALMRAPLALTMLILATSGGVVAWAQEGASAQTTATALNMRSGPDETQPVIASLAYGTNVTLEGRSANGYWVLVRAPEQGLRGWVSIFYLAANDGVSLMSLPIVQEQAAAEAPAPPEAPPPAAPPLAPPSNPVTNGLAHTISTLNMRRGPGANHLSLITLEPQTALALEGRDASGGWALVHTIDNRLRGWVYTGYLRLGEGVNLDALPVVDEIVVPVMPTLNPALVTGGPTNPIVPTITAHAREIYLRGQALGNDPYAFSVTGDCHSDHRHFLVPFGGYGSYNLGEYAYLQETINHFSGSFARPNQTAQAGFTSASILDPTWANPSVCLAGETPLACEFRIHRPSVFFINFGSDAYQWDQFRQDMRTIVEFSIEHGAIPILGTKADNREGDGWINAFIVQLAAEYDVPLWNYWLAVQGLPGGGLRGDDNYHLLWGQHDFRTLAAFQIGGSVRNLTALMALDAVRREAMY